jgi:hypothetical protein
MRKTWTIHCHPNGCYWECISQSAGEKPQVMRSRIFTNRAEATLDAQDHGLDPDNPDHLIVRKNYQS